MNEQARYVLIDNEYKIYFHGYYHSLPAANSANEFIEITAPYSHELYDLVKNLPATASKIELYNYDPEEDKMVCINTEENNWIKYQIIANFRDYGKFTLSVMYQVK